MTLNMEYKALEAIKLVAGTYIKFGVFCSLQVKVNEPLISKDRWLMLNMLCQVWVKPLQFRCFSYANEIAYLVT